MMSSAQSGSTGGQDILPQELLIIFKRVQKKDGITKCKAFKELDDYLTKFLNKPEDDEEIDPSEIEEHNNLLTFFLYHYCRILVNELDKKVREAA